MSQPDDLDGLHRPPELDEPSPEADDDAAPAVVAVVVTRNPGPFLEATLAGLADQDYPDLSVLVVDAGSTTDPTPRVAATLPDAYVHRGASSGLGFGGAANEALELVHGATFVLACHDDVDARARRGPHPRRGGLPVQRRDRGTQAGVGRRSRGAPRGGSLHRPARRLAHRHRARRARPGAARRGAGRVLRVERRDARCAPTCSRSSAASTRPRSPAPKTSTCAGELAWPAPAWWSPPTRAWRARRGGDAAPTRRRAHRPATWPATGSGSSSPATRRRPCCGPSRSGSGWRSSRRSSSRRRPAAARRTAVLGAWRWNLLRPRQIHRLRRRAQAGRSIHDRELRELQVGATRASRRVPLPAPRRRAHRIARGPGAGQHRVGRHHAGPPRVAGPDHLRARRRPRVSPLPHLRRAGRRLVHALGRDPVARRRVHLAVAVHVPGLHRRAPAGAGDHGRARDGARRQRRARPGAAGHPRHPRRRRSARSASPATSAPTAAA